MGATLFNHLVIEVWEILLSSRCDCGISLSPEFCRFGQRSYPVNFGPGFFYRFKASLTDFLKKKNEKVIYKEII